MLIKVAWRNIWRSRRRSLITASSIFFAVIFAILYRTFIVGLLDKTIADTVSMSCGYIQVHHSGYWNNQSVDNTFKQNPALLSILNHEKGIKAWAPRLESFSLASSGQRTKGILLEGIDPVKEAGVSNLPKKIIAGNYLADSDKSILLAQGLADYLKQKVNDTVVLLGQGYHGEMAAGKYAVKGIVKLDIQEMNKGMAWLTIPQTRKFLSTGERYSSISLMVRSGNNLDELKKDLINKTKGMGYEWMTWQQMLPELDQFFHLEMAGDYGVMTGILYLVIAFGIFGTLLMMLNERMHEFGLLIAIGMKKGMIAAMVILETFLISLTGTFLGILAAFPIVLYFRIHPIPMNAGVEKMAEEFNIEPFIQPSIALTNFTTQGYIVFIISGILSLYTIYKIKRIKCINAINS